MRAVCVGCQFSGGEGGRDSVWSVERRLRVQFKADVDEGGSGRFWLLRGRRMRGSQVRLLLPLLLYKAMLGLLRQTVLLFLLLLLQENIRNNQRASQAHCNTRMMWITISNARQANINLMLKPASVCDLTSTMHRVAVQLYNQGNMHTLVAALHVNTFLGVTKMQRFTYEAPKCVFVCLLPLS